MLGQINVKLIIRRLVRSPDTFTRDTISSRTKTADSIVRQTSIPIDLNRANARRSERGSWIIITNCEIHKSDNKGVCTSIHTPTQTHVEHTTVHLSHRHTEGYSLRFRMCVCVCVCVRVKLDAVVSGWRTVSLVHKCCAKIGREQKGVYSNYSAARGLLNSWRGDATLLRAPTNEPALR